MIEDIYNYLQLTDSLATGGQPTAEQLADVSAAGYEVVINLATGESEEDLPDERRLVEALGMEYIHIPVVWRDPQPADLRRFSDAMDAQPGRKVFVHCIANMRVSAFVALYRTLRLGWEWEEAYADVDRVWTPTDWWKTFIEARLSEGKI